MSKFFDYLPVLYSRSFDRPTALQNPFRLRMDDLLASRLLYACTGYTQITF